MSELVMISSGKVLWSERGQSIMDWVGECLFVPSEWMYWLTKIRESVEEEECVSEWTKGDTDSVWEKSYCERKWEQENDKKPIEIVKLTNLTSYYKIKLTCETLR